MTQLDIPQISFARYLELLKRRRWQVIPVTLLGLIIGTGVAFLIPRYYVARTQFSFQGDILGVPVGGTTQDDPMRAVVDNIKIFIPGTVQEVVGKLGWPEAQDEDMNRRRAFIEATKDRVTVDDPNGGWRGQRIVSLQITYRDTDGQRAADFANELRDSFISTQRQKLESQAQRSLDAVQKDVEEATLALENIAKDLQAHRSSHQIDPQEDVLGEALQRVGLREEWSDAKSELGRLEGEREGARLSLESKQRQIIDKTVKPRRTIITQDETIQALRNRQSILRAQLERDKAKLKNLKPAHPEYRLLKAAVDELESTLALDPSLSEPQIRTEPNPRFTDLKLEIAELEIKEIGLVHSVARQQQVVDAFETRLAELPEIWRQYEEFQNRYQEALADKAHKTERETLLLEKFNQIKNEDAFEILWRANVPPAPTEPSILVVSILGAVIGLVLAIALILVIDLLQSTFKTVDDVEQALSIPVLGGMAYLQTHEERIRVRSRRRRLALGATAFLGLNLVVVMIYYLAPTRLPAVVYQVLDMLLGNSV